MKKNKFINNFIIIFSFVIVITFPFYAQIFDINDDISGANKKVDFSFDNISEYVIQNFPGRSFLIRTKNQIMYSLFDVSPNEIITKVQDTLYSIETLDYYYHGLHYVENREVENLVQKLLKLKKICDVKNKKLLIITTPTKPRYVHDSLPFADDIINIYQKRKYDLPYEILKKKLKNTQINYFDAIDYIDEHKETIIDGEVPLFYKSGHHWSNYKGNLVGLGLMDYMREHLNIVLPNLQIKATPSSIAIHPDDDLFEVLNVYDVPNEKFYSSVVEYNDINYEELNYLIQGGSFLSALLFPYFTIGLRNQVFHIENKVLIYNKYNDTYAFENYDELNDKIQILDKLKNIDIIVLEINELNVYNATFEFLDYLIENEGYF